MPGDHVELVADGGGRIASFVEALARFPNEPTWALVGGFAVNVRIERVHRLTNDIDTVARDQTQLVELLVAEPDADRLDAAKLRFTAGGLPVDIDVMADTEGLPLPTELGERVFALARRATLPGARPTELVVVNGRTTVARATVPVASTAGLVLLKTVAIQRRSASNDPHTRSDPTSTISPASSTARTSSASPPRSEPPGTSSRPGSDRHWSSGSHPSRTSATPTPASAACLAPRSGSRNGPCVIWAPISGRGRRRGYASSSNTAIRTLRRLSSNSPGSNASGSNGRLSHSRRSSCSGCVGSARMASSSL